MKSKVQIFKLKSKLKPQKFGTKIRLPNKGKVSWGFLPSFVENGDTRPSLCHKVILEKREERNQLSPLKEQLVICSSAFLKEKCENLKNVGLTKTY